MRPFCNLIDLEGGLLLEIALPGVVETDIDVAILPGRLVVRAERIESGGRYVVHEIDRGLLVREVELEPKVEIVRSSFEDGILTLELRKL